MNAGLRLPDPSTTGIKIIKTPQQTLIKIRHDETLHFILAHQMGNLRSWAYLDKSCGHRILEFGLETIINYPPNSLLASF